MSAIKFHLSTSQDKDLDYEDSRRKEDTSEEEEGNNRLDHSLILDSGCLNLSVPLFKTLFLLVLGLVIFIL